MGDQPEARKFPSPPRLPKSDAANWNQTIVDDDARTKYVCYGRACVWNNTEVRR